MNEFANYFEYSVQAANEGAHRRTKILFIVGYVLFAAVFMTLVFISKLIPLGAFVVVATAVLVHFTWKYVELEYEYIIVRGEMTFAKIYGGRARHEFLNVKLQDMSLIAPYNDRYKAKADAADKKYYAVSSMKSPDVYFGAFKGKNSENCTVFFEATSKALKLAKFYNSSATVLSDTLRY